MDPHAPAPPTDAPAEGGAHAEADRPRETQLLTTGEMARLSNSTLRTVRFYEEEGILRPARRTDGGHRLFERTELDRLMLVTDMRMAGLSLDDIKAILDVKKTASSGSAAAQQATKVLAARIDELKEKLAVLNRLRDDLEETTKIVEPCMRCEDDRGFPTACETCTVMTSHPVLPRSVRVLWSINPCNHDPARKVAAPPGGAEGEKESP
ncbi:helix-turn-helix domain-containing protein [Polyangium mundeleinium]|uniref:MerR family transcriptional regulator n=1 Tax=Polyangium mundeleinium TaxID=2995306 RepID=A0ABT5F418_9BACT|nr:MerR family transcriptional regulator [Polyangium mundeleinium]MDC0748828.1 MerR family transcriptional regulator [Polyangium mundeleinium]